MFLASESHDLSQAEKERKVFAKLSKFTKRQLFPKQRRELFDERSEEKREQSEVDL